MICVILWEINAFCSHIPMAIGNRKAQKNKLSITKRSIGCLDPNNTCNN